MKKKQDYTRVVPYWLSGIVQEGQIKVHYQLMDEEETTVTVVGYVLEYSQQHLIMFVQTEKDAKTLAIPFEQIRSFSQANKDSCLFSLIRTAQIEVLGQALSELNHLYNDLFHTDCLPLSDEQQEKLKVVDRARDRVWNIQNKVIRSQEEDTTCI